MYLCILKIINLTFKNQQLCKSIKYTRWTFTYIGADHDVEKFATNLSISNTMRFEKNEADMQEMFSREGKSRRQYSNKIRLNEATTDNFYEEDADEKKDKDEV